MSASAVPAVRSVSSADEFHQMLAAQIAAQQAEFQSKLRAAQAAHTATPAAGIAPAVPAISEGLFLQHLNAMQVHYVSGPGAIAARMASVHPTVAKPVHLYKLPSEIMMHMVRLGPAVGGRPGVHTPTGPVRVVARGSDAGARAVEDVIAGIHSDSLAMIQQHSEQLVALSQEAERTRMTTAQFSAQMNALRDRDKHEAEARIEAIYKKAAAAGNAHPNQRARLLEAANHGSNLINSLFGGFALMGNTVEHDVTAVLHAAASPVVKTVQTVAKWASGAVHNVGSFIGHLF